jgi:arsenate reductase-like glutaredoxin family protein
VTETVSATTKYDATAALGLLAGMTRLIAAKGKSVVEFDLKKGRPDDATLLAHLLGPTGNLRAPTAKVGKTLVVGFNPEAYEKVLG